MFTFHILDQAALQWKHTLDDLLEGATLQFHYEYHSLTFPIASQSPDANLEEPVSSLCRKSNGIYAGQKKYSEIKIIDDVQNHL